MEMEKRVSAFSVWKKTKKQRRPETQKLAKTRSQSLTMTPEPMTSSKKRRRSNVAKQFRQATPHTKFSEHAENSTLLPININLNMLTPKQINEHKKTLDLVLCDGFEESVSQSDMEAHADDCKNGKKRNKDCKRRKLALKTSTPSSDAEDVNESKPAKVTRKSKPKFMLHPIEEVATSSKTVEAVIVNPEPHYMYDSLVEGRKCMEWLIHPVKPERFFSELWERKPLLVKRHNPYYFKDLFSTEVLDQILRDKPLMFGKNIDITTYTNSERKTHNPPGRAYPSIVWDHYANGCSVRLLNPQTFCRAVWKLSATLQEYFGSFVGANIYLTPAGSQGFAPHYDDIEAFVVQLEGKKKWKLYSPRNSKEVLPRVSSKNFTGKDIGEHILDVELEPGDLLYFPRGIIHQACTVPDQHSLHMTVSTSQKNSWGDFMELLIPRALEIAIENDVDFRESLPLNYMSFTGIANSDTDSLERKSFLEKVQKLFTKMLDYSPIDSAADQMAKKFIHDSMPPLLTKREKLRSIHGSGEQWIGDTVVNGIELDPDTRVKFLRANLVRLVMEEDAVRLYFSTENAREYHLEEAQYMEIPPELAPGIEFLIHAYPKYTTLEELPFKTLEQKMEVGHLLYDKGLLMTSDVLDPEENGN